MTAFKNSSMAAKKTSNYFLYKQLYPEFRFSFCGDSGQVCLPVLALPFWSVDAEADA